MRFHLIRVLGAALVALGVGVVALTASAPPLAAVPPGELRVALGAEPRSLDPHTTTALSDFRVLANVYEGLVRFERGGLGIEPALAERWKIAEGGREVTFFLRRGVRFHDGTPFDAEAVRFNLRRLIDPAHPQHDTGPFPLAFFFESVKDVQVIDAHTARFVLKEPFAPLLSNLAYPVGFMVSPTAVRRHGRDFARVGCGTGPFAVTRFGQDRAVLLERNAAYWGPAAKLERVRFRPIADAMTRVVELATGGVDVLPEVTADVLPWFRGSDEFSVHERTGPHLWFLILNAREAPFSDVRARRAVNLAVDRRRLTEKVLQGTAEPAVGAIPSAFAWARHRELGPYPLDRERARALLDAVGRPRTPLRMLVPKGGSGMLEPELMATAIQADLKRVGLDVEIVSYEWNAYLAEVNAGLDAGVHMAAMAWMVNDPDTLPYLALRRAAWPPKGFNSGWYENERVDALIEQGRRETSLPLLRGSRGASIRTDIYRQLDRLLYDDAPWLFVASWRQGAVSRRRVHGLSLEPSFLFHLRDVEAH